MNQVNQEPGTDQVPLPNDKDLRRRYGITLDQYRELLEYQGGVCAICGKPPTQRTGPLVVDHDHDTLTIDGLVHGSPCNRRLTQQVRHYLADPPGRRFGWVVPADREARTITRREAAKEQARVRRAEMERIRTAALSRTGTTQVPDQDPGTSHLERLRAMTRPGPDDFHARTQAALAAKARYDREAERKREAEREREEREARESRAPKRRLRLRFRTGT